MAEISVIVPVYNAEKYLPACLDSILNQTFRLFELILIDDGSTDSSGLLCDLYAKKDSRIRVFHQANQGQGAARNFGVRQSEADWIHFVDSDDVIHPQMLEILHSMVILNNTPISVCSIKEDYHYSNFFNQKVCGSNYVMPMNEDVMISLYKDIPPYIYWISCGKLIKKELVLKHPFAKGKIYEDNAVVCRWLYDAKKISVTDEYLYFYRINSEGTTKKAFNVKHCDFLWALQEQIRFFKKNKYNKLAEQISKRYLINFKIYFEKTQLLLSDKKIGSKLKKQALFFVLVNLKCFIRGKYDLLWVFETFFSKQYHFLFGNKNK